MRVIAKVIEVGQVRRNPPGGHEATLELEPVGFQASGTITIPCGMDDARDLARNLFSRVVITIERDASQDLPAKSMPALEPDQK